MLRLIGRFVRDVILFPPPLPAEEWEPYKPPSRFAEVTTAVCSVLGVFAMIAVMVWAFNVSQLVP